MDDHHGIPYLVCLNMFRHKHINMSLCVLLFFTYRVESQGLAHIQGTPRRAPASGSTFSITEESKGHLPSSQHS